MTELGDSQKRKKKKKGAQSIVRQNMIKISDKLREINSVDSFKLL